MKEKTIKILVNVKATFRDARTGRITKQIKAHNLVVNTGLNSIAARLSGVSNPTTKGSITYCALGTGTDAPAAGDTTLQTELIRKQVSVRSFAANVAQFRTFFNTSEGNDTIREIGLFGDDASASANSGTLFARLAVNKTKTSAETLTLDWQVSVAAA